MRTKACSLSESLVHAWLWGVFSGTPGGREKECLAKKIRGGMISFEPLAGFLCI